MFKNDLKKRGLVKSGFSLPYNPGLLQSPSVRPLFRGVRGVSICNKDIFSSIES